MPIQGGDFELDLPPPRSLRGLTGFHGSLSQRVYGSLREAILNLSLRPGDIIRKPEICEALGVSRSPVSEALARLAGEHLVQVIPQAGTYVARLSLAEVREGAFLREALEMAAVDLVARQVSDEQLVQLRRNMRLQAALVEDHDFTGFYQADAEFHALILGFTGFRRITALAEVSWLHVNRARQLLLPHKGRVEATLAEHQAIVAAIEAGDPEAARQATRAHLGKLIGILTPLAKSRPDLFDPD